MATNTATVYKNQNYSVIPVLPLRDNRLSLTSKGLLAELSAYGGTEICIDDLVNRFGSPSEIFSSINELEEAGYIIIEGGDKKCRKW